MSTQADPDDLIETIAQLEVEVKKEKERKRAEKEEMEQEKEEGRHNRILQESRGSVVLVLTQKQARLLAWAVRNVSFVDRSHDDISGLYELNRYLKSKLQKDPDK